MAAKCLSSQVADKAVSKTYYCCFRGPSRSGGKTHLTSYNLCITSVWKWKSRILGIFTVVRYHPKMPKLFYKLSLPFSMLKKKKSVLFFFGMLCF